MKTDVVHLILGSGTIVKFVLLILAAQSVISWGIILLKVRILRKARRNSDRFLEYFWSQKDLEMAFRKTAQQSFCPLASVFAEGFSEFRRAKQEDSEAGPDLLENVERALRRAVTTQLTFLEGRTAFLATTGSSAPFIGLFGTVWGIMNSFLNIGASGATSLAVVAPGISEALIATAVGLVAAIPAVVGYNYCMSKIRILHREMENFSNDFLNIIKRNLTRT